MSIEIILRSDGSWAYTDPTQLQSYGKLVMATLFAVQYICSQRPNVGVWAIYTIILLYHLTSYIGRSNGGKWAVAMVENSVMEPRYETDCSIWCIFGGCCSTYVNVKFLLGGLQYEWVTHTMIVLRTIFTIWVITFKVTMDLKGVSSFSAEDFCFGTHWLTDLSTGIVTLDVTYLKI